MKKITLLCSLLIATLFYSKAATYYVNTTGSNGDGLSTATAWTALTKINSAVIKPGDKVLFEGGKTFTGNITLDAGDANDSANPVTFTSYGTGKAIIKTSSTTVCGFQSTNTQGITITNMIFEGPGNGATYLNKDGVQFYTTLASGYLTNFVVRNVEVRKFGFCGIRCYSNYVSTVKAGFRRVVIDSCTVHDCRENGIVTQGYSFLNVYQHKNVKVTNCEVYNVTGYQSTAHKGSGILFGQLDSALIERCVAHDNGKLQTSSNGGPGGIWVWETNNAVIQYCESYNNSGGTGTDGLGFDLDGGVTNSTIQYCYSHDNDGAGYLLGDFGSGYHPWKNNVVRYCISANDAKMNHSPISLFSGKQWVVTPNGDVDWDGLKFYNNTIIGKQYSRKSSNLYLTTQHAMFEMAGNGSATMKNIKCYNNIFYAVNMDTTINVDPNLVSNNPSFINNIYWNANSKPFKALFGATSYTSLSAFRDEVKGRERLSGSDYGLFTDPLLNSIPGTQPTLWPSPVETLNAYLLTASSPAKDAGLDLNALFSFNIGLQDYWGIPGKKGTKYDIGANEFDTGFVPPIPTLNSIVPAELVASLTIYPNPCYGQTTIEFANPDAEQVVVSIYDIAGNLLMQKTTTYNLCQFDGIALPEGAYIVAVRGVKVNAVGKLLKK